MIRIMITAELMPFGMDSSAELMPVGMGSFSEIFPRDASWHGFGSASAYAFWHGFVQ